ncbi:MAG: hypothetical protein J4O09_06495, partial [Chloroflexi bacterium]|nr:hypothetical protein [Chloroflexota bacterium]
MPTAKWSNPREENPSKTLKRQAMAQANKIVTGGCSGHLLNQSQGGIYMDNHTNPGSFDCHPER